MEANKMEFEFGSVDFQPCYLCLEVNEAENFTIENFEEILEVKIAFYSDKKIGYLSYRTHSFSFDPSILVEKKIKIRNHFNKLAIVSKREVDQLESAYIKKISPIPSRYFDRLSEAKKWLLP